MTQVPRVTPFYLLRSDFVMSTKFKETYRGYLVDHHSPDPPAISFSKLSATEWEAFFQEANINSYMLYCKDHWGSSYYDTQVGRKHPALGERDWVAELVPVLRRNNIEFIAYYCFEYDSWAPKAHPEWSVMTADGQPHRCGMPTNSNNARWGIPCLHTGYRDYVLGQLREIVERYHPDSLFIDIFGMTVCYCATCRALFRERFGYDLPETPEGLLEHNNDVVRYLDDEAERMLDDVRSSVLAIDPTLAITVNFSSHYPRRLRDKLDYMFTEPWAGNWLSGAYARDTSAGKPVQLGPGDISQVFNYQPASVYELAAAEIAAQGCRVFLYSESMREDGTLEHEEARRVGHAFREVEKFESYLTGRTLHADIAIVQSDLADTLRVTEPVQLRCVGRAMVSGRHRKALLGAMKLCDASKLTWGIVPELELDYARMCRYQMIILPNLFHISPRLCEDLRRYVAQGGRLLLSGECGICDENGTLLPDFALQDLMGCHLIEKDETYQRNKWSAYITQTDDPIWTHSAKTTPPVSEYTLHTRPDGARSLGSFLDPAVLLTDTTWANWGNPLPGQPNGFHAFYEHTCGAGTVLTACFDLCTMAGQDFPWTFPFFQDLTLRYLHPSVYLSTQYPRTMEYTCYRRGSDLIVHELSALVRQTGGDAPVVPGGCLRLDPAQTGPVVSACQVYPQTVPLTVRTVGDHTEIDLLPLSIHAVYQITTG